MTEPVALRILVVENHEDTRAVLVMLLEMMGHTVRAAGSVREALEVAPEAGWNMLISDIGLPDGDGWELMRRLPRPTPFYAVAMSGYGTQADRERSRTAGFRHHLVKPMDADLLDRILAEALAELRPPP